MLGDTLPPFPWGRTDSDLGGSQPAVELDIHKAHDAYLGFLVNQHLTALPWQ